MRSCGLLCVLALLWACGGTEEPTEGSEADVSGDPGESEPAAAERSVTVSGTDAKPIAGAPPDAYVFVGEIEASQLTEVRFSVAGRVERVLVESGTRVQVGTVLARLDELDRREDLDTVRERIATARSVIPSVGGRHRPGKELPSYLEEEMELRLEELEGKEAEAKRRLKRLQEAALREGQAGATREALATQSPGAGAARRRTVASRTANERLAVALITSLEQKKRRLERELRDSVLESPVDGAVIRVGLSEGDEVETRGEDPALLLLDVQDLVVRTAVAAPLAAVLQEGEDAWVEIEGLSGARMVTVQYIDPMQYESSVGGGQSVQDVVLTLPERDAGELEIGQFVRVAIRR